MSLGLMLILLLIAAIVVWSLVRSHRSHTIPELRSLTPFYVGSKYAEKFESEEYGITGKPDFLYLLPNNEIAVVEYKSRDRNVVYNSDRVQLIAATIATRSQYPNALVGYVFTESGYYEKVDLRKTTEDLNRSISRELHNARLAEQRIEPRAFPSQAKCQRCGVRNDCEWRFE